MNRLLSLLFCFCISYSIAQNSSIKELQQTIDEISQQDIFAHGSFSVAVLDVENNNTLAENTPDKTMIPASTLKLITTATALQRLGENHRFETKLAYAGPVKSGVLSGDLVIIGGGDPCLGSERFAEYNGMIDQWVSAIKSLGITKITGDIIADNSFFQGTVVPPGWTWEDMGNYYGSGVFGLNIYDNTYHIVFESGPSVGDRTKVLRTEPHIPGLIFNNDVTSGAKNGDYAYVYNAPNSQQVYLRGTITRGQKAFKRTKGAIPNPPLYVAQLIEEKLLKEGIKISGNAKVTQSPYYRPVTFFHTTYSPELKAIIAETNAESVNLYAEALLLHAFKNADNNIYALSAAKLLTDYWEQRGVETEGMYLYDGSGLTRKNGITAKQMALIAAKSLKADTTFVNLLPCAGREGTVKYMCKGSAAEGNVWMKSGTLDRIRNYVGLCKSKNGKWVSFALFANDYSGSSYDIKRNTELILDKIASLDF